MTSDPPEIYRKRLERLAQEAAPLERRFDRIANARLIAVIAAIGSFIVAANARARPPTVALALSVAFLSGGAFVALLLKHARIHGQRERGAGLRRLNSRAIARLERAWTELPIPVVPTPFRENLLARDLDLLGRGSIFHLLGTVGTPQGRHTLVSWLVSPSNSPAEIRERQEAVAELAPALELRQDLELAAAELAPAASADENPFLSWAANDPWLLRRPGLIWATRLIPALMWLSIGLFCAGRIGLAIPLALSAAPWFLSRLHGREVQRRLNLVCARESGLRAYGALFAQLAKWQPAASRSVELHRHLNGADAAMRQLDSYAGLGGIRTTPASPLAQWLFLWNFHTLFLMERWQAEFGAQVRPWFEALGEAEALSALATLAFDHPTWPFPGFADEPRIVARGLGHPLLADGARVANDVTIGPPGTFLLVTGSNMSGKSTLLRTLGVNAILGRAGGPVCAAEMQMPSKLILATSLRVEDSLEEGVSFFMAELQRLATLVEQADAADVQPDGPMVLYLLDEILRGTNTEERQIIVGKVIGHLLKRRAIGAVTTHDLSLATVDGLSAASQAVHFTEEFAEGPEGATMRFDYRMRPGLATTTNALKLLKVIGLKI